jgi:hypothetical protein
VRSSASSTLSVDNTRCEAAPFAGSSARTGEALFLDRLRASLSSIWFDVLARAVCPSADASPPAAARAALDGAPLGPYAARTLAVTPPGAVARLLLGEPRQLSFAAHTAPEYIRWLVQQPIFSPPALGTRRGPPAAPPRLVGCGEGCFGLVLPPPWRAYACLAWVDSPQAALGAGLDASAVGATERRTLLLPKLPPHPCPTHARAALVRVGSRVSSSRGRGRSSPMRAPLRTCPSR